jgi:hypothetical protein
LKQIKTEDLIRYENDEMTNEEEVVFFQKLIDTGMAWTLQGHYGRIATALIKDGLCTDPRQGGTVTPIGKRSASKT